jgi:hypothetical protein
MCGEVICRLKDFLYLETAEGKVGLELNRSKIEVIEHHRDTGYMFTSYGINVSETSASAGYFSGRTASGWPTPRFGVGKEASEAAAAIAATGTHAVP